MARDDGSWPPPTTDDRKAFRGGSNGKGREFRVDHGVRIERRGSSSSVGWATTVRALPERFWAVGPEVHMAH